MESSDDAFLMHADNQVWETFVASEFQEWLDSLDFSPVEMKIAEGTKEVISGKRGFEKPRGDTHAKRLRKSLDLDFPQQDFGKPRAKARSQLRISWHVKRRAGQRK